MKKWISILICISLSGCALTHEQIAAKAHKKTNAELCMALIQFPQYSTEIEAELEERGRVCDMGLASAQVQEQNAQNARFGAALQAAAASMSQAQPTYNIVPPAQLQTQPPIQAPVISAASATAYFTGQQKQVQTVTYQYGWSCEYRYAAQTFWRTFVGSCPSSIQVQ